MSRAHPVRAIGTPRIVVGACCVTPRRDPSEGEDAVAVCMTADTAGAVVADGVGSAGRGGDAARTAVAAVEAEIRAGERDAVTALRTALTAVASASGGDPSWQTTITVVIVDHTHVSIAWVGDSPAFVSSVQSAQRQYAGQRNAGWTQMTVPAVHFVDDRPVLATWAGPGASELDISSTQLHLQGPFVVMVASDGVRSTERALVDGSTCAWEEVPYTLLAVQDAIFTELCQLDAPRQQPDSPVVEFGAALEGALRECRLDDDTSVAVIVRRVAQGATP